MINWFLWFFGIRHRSSRKELIAEISTLNQKYRQLLDAYGTLLKDADESGNAHNREVEQLRKAALQVNSASRGSDGAQMAGIRDRLYLLQKDNYVLMAKVNKLTSANKKLRQKVKDLQ